MEGNEEHCGLDVSNPEKGSDSRASFQDTIRATISAEKTLGAKKDVPSGRGRQGGHPVLNPSKETTGKC